MNKGQYIMIDKNRFYGLVNYRWTMVIIVDFEFNRSI